MHWRPRPCLLAIPENLTRGNCRLNAIAGSQVPSQSRCCTRRRLRTLHLSTGAEQGGRDARSVRPWITRARTAVTRASTCALTHAESRSHIGTPPRPRSCTLGPDAPPPRRPCTALDASHTRTHCRRVRVHVCTRRCGDPTLASCTPPPRSHAKTYAPPPRRARLCPCTAVSPLRGCLAAPLHVAARRQPGASEVTTPSSTPHVAQSPRLKWFF